VGVGVASGVLALLVVLGVVAVVVVAGVGAAAWYAANAPGAPLTTQA